MFLIHEKKERCFLYRGTHETHEEYAESDPKYIWEAIDGEGLGIEVGNSGTDSIFRASVLRISEPGSIR